jgi:hypothetical protein
MTIGNWHTMRPGALARIAVTAKRMLTPIAKIDSFKKRSQCFIHIPKTGGTSIARMFFDNIVMGHYPWWFYYYYFGMRTYENMFSFAFCRNPFTRLASAYDYLIRGGNNENDSRFSKQYLTDCAKFPDFLFKLENSKDMQNWLHFLPQHKFIFDKKNQLRVDFLARFENFSIEAESLAKRFGISSTIAHEKKGQPVDLNSFYDSDRLIGIVKQLYEKDFELLGYDTRL